MAIALALRDRALVETAYAAGLRISELAAADVGSLDLRRGEIRVIGKGRKERIGLLGRPALAALAAYLDHGRPILLDRAGTEPSEVFLNHLGAPLGVRGLRYRLDRLCRRAGLPVGVSPTLRHRSRPPARRRCGSARRPGARPRASRRPDLHARLARPAGGLPRPRIRVRAARTEA